MDKLHMSLLLFLKITSLSSFVSPLSVRFPLLVPFASTVALTLTYISIFLPHLSDRAQCAGKLIA